MSRALTLFAIAFRAQLQYRANFIIWVVMGIIYQTTGFLFIWVVLSRFPTIAGWSLGEVAFLYGIRLLAHALSVLVFGYLYQIELLVERGDFDRYLIRPVSPLVQVITAQFPVGAIGDVIGGVAVFVAASRLVTVDWTPAAVAYLGLAITGGALVEAALRLAIGTLSFRLLSTRALLFLVDQAFSTFGNYPLRIFGPSIGAVLTFVLPVAFVAYFPASVLLARTNELLVTPLLAYGAPLVGVLCFALAYIFWRHELQAYQSTGH